MEKAQSEKDEKDKLIKKLRSDLFQVQEEKKADKTHILEVSS